MRYRTALTITLELLDHNGKMFRAPDDGRQHSCKDMSNAEGKSLLEVINEPRVGLSLFQKLLQDTTFEYLLWEMMPGLHRKGNNKRYSIPQQKRVILCVNAPPATDTRSPWTYYLCIGCIYTSCRSIHHIDRQTD